MVGRHQEEWEWAHHPLVPLKCKTVLHLLALLKCKTMLLLLVLLKCNTKCKIVRLLLCSNKCHHKAPRLVNMGAHRHLQDLEVMVRRPKCKIEPHHPLGLTCLHHQGSNTVVKKVK